MSISIKSLLACGASALCMSLAAQAQSVDYNALQDTFGEPVTMSATGKPQRASDVPADMIILTQEKIRRSGATRITDVLKFVPGMDVREYGNAGTEVSVHGYLQPSTPRLLVLVNGRQVYLEDYGYVSWDTIPVQLTEIQQIEIVKGPGSSLFGFNAVAGVVNIITIDPQKTETAVFQFTGGSRSTKNASIVIARHLTPQLAFKIAGGYNRQQADSVDPKIGITKAPQSYSASADIRWQALDKMEVRAEGTWMKSRSFEMIAPSGFARQEYATYSYKLGATADTAYGLIDLSAYRNHMTDMSYSTYGLVNIGNDVSVLSASNIFKAGSSLTVRLAAEYRNSVNTFSIFGKDGSEDIAGSAMVDWAISEKLSWTNSVRIDAFSPRAAERNFTHDHEAVSYNSGLVWKATEDDTLRLLAGRSVQTPALIGMIIFGDDFKPSTLDKVELSWDHAFTSISSKFHVGVYQQWYSDLLGFAAGNVGSSESTGVDVSLDGAAHGWSWNISINARSVSDNIKTLAAPAANYQLDFANTTPKWVGTFGIGKSWGAFELDLMGKWQSDYTDWDPAGATFANGFVVDLSRVSVHIPSYLTMTARLGWKITDRLTFAVTASQFNKKAIYEGAGVPNKARFLASLTASL